jgi:tRNA 2-thiouridine synthesizing protein A
MIIDAKKLLCPMPVIRLGEAINKANVGDEITVIATDYGVLHDIPAWCKVHNQKVLSVEDGDIITIVVKKVN